MKAKLAAYFSDYAAFHTDPRNKTCHLIGVPLIVMSIFGILGPQWALGLWLGVNLWYLTLDLRLGAGFAVVSLGLLAVGLALQTWLLWTLFVLGWVSQGVGHKFEGRSPAFLRNVVHLLIGPLWIFQGLTKLARL